MREAWQALDPRNEGEVSLDDAADALSRKFRINNISTAYALLKSEACAK